MICLCISRFFNDSNPYSDGLQSSFVVEMTNKKIQCVEIVYPSVKCHHKIIYEK